MPLDTALPLTLQTHTDRSVQTSLICGALNQRQNFQVQLATATSDFARSMQTAVVTER